METTLEASADDVWDAMSEPGNLESVHPFCASNPVIRWPGDDSLDEIHYLNGLVMERVFRRWLDGVGCDLDIRQPGGPASFVTWRVSRRGRSQCSLRIVVHPHLLQGVPAVVRWLPYATVVRPRLEMYLSSVINGVDWFVRTGTPVPRNQWGRHPWFS